ncbi:hypothetical protein [Flavobacterium micromati]|nr:hypothetical protein [Flavobacterium micromati]
MPSFTTARIAFLFLVLMSIMRNYGIPKKVFYYLFVLFLVLAVAFIQFIFKSDSTQLSRLFWFMIYGVISPFLFVNFLKSRKEFLLLVSVAVVIQAVLSILSFMNPAIKALFYNLVIFTSNFEEEQVLRAVAFASIGGAGLSVIQSLGVISSIALLKLNDFSIYNKVLLWVGITITLISIFLIGRTGLFISFLFIAGYLISEIKSFKSTLIFVLIIGAIYQVNFVSILENMTANVDGFNIDLFTSWIENAFKLKGNDTSEVLASMPIPPISFETIIGTGRVVDESGLGNASMHDSGYIQTYYSLGLLCAFYFYCIYIIFLLLQLKSKSNVYNYFLILVMLIIEVKEPFIFQYVFPFFVLSIILVTARLSDSNEVVINKELNINLN